MNRKQRNLRENKAKANSLKKSNKITSGKINQKNKTQEDTVLLMKKACL